MTLSRSIRIGSRKIDRPCCIIAEPGVNHNGLVKIAHRLIGAAWAAGADVAKVRAFGTDAPTRPDAAGLTAHGHPA